MTDGREDDELVAAVVDGEASAEEEARVAADPVLQARAAQFRSVAAAVATDPSPVDELARERAVQAALAAAPAASETKGHSPARGSGRPALPRPLLAAAAVVAALAAGAGLLAQLDSGDGDDGRQLADSVAPDLAPGPLELGPADTNDQIRMKVAAATDLVASTDGTEGADAPDEQADASAAATEGDGGGGAAPEALADRQVAAGGTDDAEPGRLSEECEIAAVEANPDLLGQLAQGTLVYRGVDAFVYLYNTADGADIAVLVIAADDCRGLDRFVF